MNERIHTLKSIQDCSNLTGRQKYIIQSTVEHLEHLQKQCCEDCVHYTNESTILGAIDYKDCKHNFNCTVVRINNFEAKAIE